MDNKNEAQQKLEQITESIENKPILNEVQKDFIKQGAYLTLKKADLTDPLDNRTYDQRNRQIIKNLGLLSAYFIFFARITEISNLYIPKNPSIMYASAIFFPSLIYGGYQAKRMSQYQYDLDLKYTDLYIKVYQQQLN